MTRKDLIPLAPRRWQAAAGAPGRPVVRGSAARDPAGATPPQLSDESVALACASGDPAAVAELFDRFGGPVSRFLSRLVGPGPDIDDLVQATFLEVLHRRPRFDQRSAARTWVFGIAANIARHHLRSTSRRRRLACALQSAPPRGEARDQIEELAARQSLRLAAQSLAALPPEQRLALVLCEIEGLSAREAGEILGRSETAVWKLVSRARAALLDAIGGRR